MIVTDPGSIAPPGPIVVTGGLGCIGANLVRLLVDRGYAVRIIDDYSNLDDPPPPPAGVAVTRGSILDEALLAPLLAGAAGVVHLAASTSVQDSVEHPEMPLTVNVNGTFAVLQAARAAGVRRFVLASSNAAAGEHEPPLDESVLPRPLSPYGASKLAGEAFCSAFSGTYGLDTVALRFANVYGRYAAHKPSVIAKFFGRIERGEALTIYGDGRQTRDFVHASDVARAVIGALETPGAGPMFQVGTGRETSVLELITLLGEVTGIEPRLEWLPELPGEIRRNAVSIAAARAAFGYEPQMELRAGLEDTYRWLRAGATAGAVAVGAD